MNHAQPSVESGHAVPNGVHTRVGDAINGDRPPELTASNNANDTSLKINGNHVHHSHSPAADSPATPVSSDAVPDVKIDIDYQEQESDVRHEPVAIKNIELIDKRDISTVPQVGTPLDPDSIPIHPPHGTPPPQEGDLLEDVKMAEHVPNGINGNHANGTDVEMSDATPTPTPGPQQDSSMATLDDASSSQTRPASYDDDEGPPPAKRARMHSDADKASFAHSATPPPASAAASDAAGSPVPPPPSSTAPPPTSASTPPPYTGRPSAFSVAQFRFCQSTVRSLKKLKDAVPFLRPVDYVALQIPHYPSIIKHPMDFSTVERKLTSSNPAKPDPNPMNPRYMTTDEFVADVRLIFANTMAFNGPEHAVTLMGKRVEEVFDKQLKHMPPNIEPKPPIVKKVATPPPPPPPPAPIKKPIARRPSTSVPVIRRNDQEAIGRPKREIHPPPPKDLPYAEPLKKSKKGKRVKDNGTTEQLKFCGRILQELHRKQHYDIAHPFYEPVDWVKLEIPAYPKIVKKPMDLSTIRRKLDAHEYSTAQKFFDDFKLMIRNCFLFNPAGTPVNQAGIELQRLFDDKWKSLPPLHAVDPSDDEEEDEDDEEEEERQRAIAAMESQIETMRSNLTALKHKAPEKKKKEKKKEKPPVASTSKAPVKQAKAPTKKSTKKKPVADDDVLTFEQKKDLSESISKLDETKLEKVIQIIHEGVPEIRDSTEEIELEIDLLPAAVLTKLYNFVIRPQRQAPAKRSRVGKGGGTGGLKRKSMDEDVEAEKIRQLEERMALFEQGATGAPAPAPHRDDGSEHSSDDSSDDSSGSDSD
ncbi:Bromodomain-containing protein [Crucibulum laeve]|uniref:Bromodomain-containing protein n=1 Tax=Crucibulum laeve TaxID=68775 RepID=A0A5C3MA91_9AGAR|nr:Bromodomain-containing protein [Crucibulum laeve]